MNWYVSICIIVWTLSVCVCVEAFGEFTECLCVCAAHHQVNCFKRQTFDNNTRVGLSGYTNQYASIKNMLTLFGYHIDRSNENKFIFYCFYMFGFRVIRIAFMITKNTILVQGS